MIDSASGTKNINKTTVVRFTCSPKESTHIELRGHEIAHT